MKIIRTLKITSDEFYDELESSILGMMNYKENSSKKYTIKDIKPGFKMSQKAEEGVVRTDYEIKNYQRGKEYIIKVRTIDETSVLSYKTQPVENGLEVIYEQQMQNFEKKKQNKFLKGWSSALYLSRMSNQLYDTESKIVRKRNNETYDPNPMQTMAKKLRPVERINKRIVSAVVKHDQKKEAKAEEAYKKSKEAAK